MLVRALTQTTMRTRSRIEKAVQKQSGPQQSIGPTLQTGEGGNLMYAYPLKVTGSSPNRWDPDFYTKPELDKSETIVDEKSPLDGVKYVSHEIRTGYGVVPLVKWCGNSWSSSYAYPSLNAPRPVFADVVQESQHPAGSAINTARILAKFDLVNGGKSHSAFPVLPDRLGEVPKRLVAKLEQLHLANSAWEARELPELFDLFKRRNLLALPRGARWVTGWNMDGMGRNMIDRTGMASKAFLRYLSANYLGYTFGLAPTVGDVAAICSSLKNGLKARKNRVTATIVGGKQSVYDAKLWSGTGMVSGRLQERFQKDRVDGVRATLVRPMYGSDFFNRMLTALLGINGATALWEAVPFSWAVDYFLSIDAVLDILWCQSQTEYRLEYWSSEKVRYERLVDYSYISQWQGNGTFATPVYADGPTVRAEYSNYERTPRVQPSAFDGLRSRLSPTKVFTMAMVAIGLVKGSYIPKHM